MSDVNNLDSQDDDVNTESISFGVREPVVGQTGTYQVIFKNGIVITIPMVRLAYVIPFGSGKYPVLQSFSRPFGWREVVFTPSQIIEERYNIEAIIRISDDE